MHSFSTPWKHQKTLWKGCISNKWVNWNASDFFQKLEFDARKNFEFGSKFVTKAIICKEKSYS